MRQRRSVRILKPMLTPRAAMVAVLGWRRSLSRSLGLITSSHLRLLDWVLPVMQMVHRTSWIYDGRLPNRHIWRHLLLAASTARTSMGARVVMASAGCGKSCCLLTWHPATDVSTGRHLRSDRSATIAPLPVGSTPWSVACGNTVSSRSRSDDHPHHLCALRRSS